VAKRTGGIELVGGIISASGAAIGDPGDNINITAGAGNATSGDGGSVNLTAGAAVGAASNHDGGDVVLTPGAGVGSGSVGGVVITPVGTPTDTTNKLYNDGGALTWNGTDISTGGSGDVTKVGTPVDNQVGIWTGDGTLEGDAIFTLNNSAPTATLTFGDGSTIVSPNITMNGTAAGSPIINFQQGGVQRGSVGFFDNIGGSADTVRITSQSGPVQLAPTNSLTLTATNGEGIELFDGGIVFNERADHATTPVAAKGELWVRNDTPNTLVYTDDTGTDFDLLAAGGDVTKVGTPVDNQIGVWTGDGTIEGDTNFQWNGSVLSIGASGWQLSGLNTTTFTFTGGAAGTVQLLIENSANTDLGSIIARTTGSGQIGFTDAGGGNTYIAENDGDHIWSTDGATEIMRLNRIAAGDGVLELTGSLAIDERSDHALTPTAGIGEIWVRNDSPNSLMFTDDAGTDFVLNSTSAGGSDTQLQYNNGGVLGGIAGTVWDDINGDLRFNSTFTGPFFFINGNTVNGSDFVANIGSNNNSLSGEILGIDYSGTNSADTLRINNTGTGRNLVVQDNGSTVMSIAATGYIDDYPGSPADGEVLTWNTSNGRAEFTAASGASKFAQDNTTTATSEVFNHALGSLDVIVQVFDLTVSPREQFVPTTVEITDANNVTITVPTAPGAAGEYRVVVMA